MSSVCERTITIFFLSLGQTRLGFEPTNPHLLEVGGGRPRKLDLYILVTSLSLYTSLSLVQTPAKMQSISNFQFDARGLIHVLLHGLQYPPQTKFRGVYKAFLSVWSFILNAVSATDLSCLWMYFDQHWYEYEPT